MKTFSLLSERTKVLFAFFNIYFVWGATYFAITFAINGFPPFILSTIRFLTVGILLLIWRKFKKDTPLTIKNIGFASISGILILVAGTGLVSWSQQYISSSEAAILGATQPFFFILFDRSQWKIYFSKFSIILGLLIGFTGLILFINQRQVTSNSSDSSAQFIAYIVLIGSAASWVSGALFSRKNAQKFNSSLYLNAAWQFIAAGFVTGLIGFGKNDWDTFSLKNVSLEAWYGLLFLIFAGSLISYLSFNWLITKKPAALVSTFTYVNPVIAVILGFIFLHEVISFLQIIALFIILIGVLLTNSSHYKTPKSIKIILFKIRFIVSIIFGIKRFVRIIKL